MVTADLAPDLLGALVAEVGAAEHEDGREAPRRQPGQQQQDGKDDQQLVDQRALGDLPDHRKLAGGIRSGHVLRGDGGVVDHHAGSLGAGLGRTGGHIIHGGRCDARQGGDVIQQRDQAAAHRWAPVRVRETVAVDVRRAQADRPVAVTERVLDMQKAYDDARSPPAWCQRYHGDDDLPDLLRLCTDRVARLNRRWPADPCSPPVRASGATCARHRAPTSMDAKPTEDFPWTEQTREVPSHASARLEPGCAAH